MAKRVRTEEQKLQRKINDSKPENKAKKALSDKKYYEKNKESVDNYQRQYREKNREKIKPAKNKYYRNNIELCKLRSREYAKNNIEKIRNRYNNPEIKEKLLATLRDRKKTDINFMLSARGRNRTSLALRASGTKKLMSFDEALGCTIEQFKKHIESTFKEGMSWDNRGNFIGGWVIDEIRPIASFDLSDIEQYRQCFHYSNRQALWHIENCSKGSRWNGKTWHHNNHKKNVI
jgi:hypothetical protein